jgi:mycothiol synthase
VEFVWRALTEDDAEAAAVTSMAAEAVDDLGEAYGAEDFAEALTESSIDLERGSVGVFAVDGRMAAFGLVYARTAADPVHEMHLWAVVHPDFRRRGIGTGVTERMLAAARVISEARFPGVPLAVTSSALDRVLGQIALLESTGFEAHHYEFGMLRTIGDADRAADPGVPPGYALVPFGPEVSEEIRFTHNAAFVPDHPGSTVATEQTWAERVQISSFRQDLSFGLRHEASGQMAGYVLVNYYEADTEMTGLRDAYVNYLGTRREHRRRGVGSALLSAVLHAAAKDGMDTASLGVQAENPSGALGTYEHAGFEVRRRFVVYRREMG